jgi:YHS domain-containing protein
MNAPFRIAAKACLVTATSGVLCIQVAGLFAQDSDTPTTRSTAGAKVKQVQATSQDAADQAGQPSSQSETAIQKEVRKLFNKNGHEAPSLKLEDAPNTQSPARAPAGSPNGVAGKPAIATPQPGPQTAQQPSVQPAKPNWFERTFHIGRGRKQPAPATQYATPTVPPTPPYRYPSTAPAARPAPSPYYRAPIAAAPVHSAPALAGPAKPAPVVAGPAAQASPAQPQFREPAPLGPSPAARNLAERATPPAVRPARLNKISQPLLDESGVNGDSESLDLEDDDSKVAGQAPQALPSDTADGPAESPYSGLKIAPNETEQQFVSSRPRTEPAGENKDDKAASDDLSIGSGDAARPAEKQDPAALAATKPAKPATGKGEMKDEDDDEDDDDDEMLTLKEPEPAKHAEPATEKTEKIAGKDSDKPVAPAPFTGLKGICPVVLKDNRKLLDAQPDIKSEFNGKTYTFSSIEAKQTFDENPRKYAPVGGGKDVVRLTSGEADVAGTLDHAAWYRGRLYLFSTADSRSEFVDTPSKFVIED